MIIHDNTAPGSSNVWPQSRDGFSVGSDGREIVLVIGLLPGGCTGPAASEALAGTAELDEEEDPHGMPLVGTVDPDALAEEAGVGLEGVVFALNFFEVLHTILIEFALCLLKVVGCHDVRDGLGSWCISVCQKFF